MKLPVTSSPPEIISLSITPETPSTVLPPARRSLCLTVASSSASLWSLIIPAPTSSPPYKKQDDTDYSQLEYKESEFVCIV